MSHELRTPLNSLLLLAAGLTERLGQTLRPRAEDKQGRVLDAFEQLDGGSARRSA